MEFRISEESLMQVIMDCLRKGHYYDSLCVLQLESGYSEKTLPKELEVLHKLCLQGNWAHVSLLLNPLRQSDTDNYYKALFYVKKQQYLEALSWMGGGGRPSGHVAWRPDAEGAQDKELDLDMDSVMTILKEIEAYCSPLEFSALCYCLTLDKLSDNPAFAQWSVSGGRLGCYEAVAALLYELPPPPDSSTIKASAKGLRDTQAPLQKLIATALQTQYTDQCQSLRGIGTHEVTWNGTDLVVDGVTSQQKSHQAHLVVESFENRKDPDTVIPARTVETVHIKSPKSKPLSSVVRPQLSTLSTDGTDAVDRPPSKRNTEVSAQMIDSLGDRTDNFSPRGQQGVSHASVIMADIPQNRDSRPRNLAGETPRLNEGHAMKDLLFGDRNDSHGDDSAPHSTVAVVQAPRRELTYNSEKVRQPPVAWVVGKTAVEQSRDSRIRQDGKPLADKPGPQFHETPRPIPPQQEEDVPAVTEEIVRNPTRNGTSKSATPKGVPFSDVYIVEDKKSPRHVQSDGSVSVKEAKPVAPHPVREPTVVYNSPGCPLRSVSLISGTRPDPASDSRRCSATFAVGSNAKSIHIFKYEGSRHVDNGGRESERDESVLSLNEFMDVHKGSVYTTDWYSAGQDSFALANGIIASGSNDKSIRLIRPFSSSPEVTTILSGHNGTVRSVKFRQSEEHKQSEVLLTSVGAGDCAVRVWDVNNERCTHAFAGHEAHVHGVDWLSSNTVISGCEKGWMICHDIRSPQYAWKAAVHQYGICTLSATPDSFGSAEQDIFLGLTKGFVSLYSPSQQRFLLPPTKVHEHDVRCVLSWESSTFHKTPTRRKRVSLLTTSFDHTAAIWDIQVSNAVPRSAREQMRQPPAEYSLSKSQGLINGHTDKILCAARCHHSGSILTTGADGKTVMWQ